jgi:hypothetical protein
MGWKDLFKSKPPDATPDPRLRWFGKLPTYGDYYSSANDADWAVEFNDWILKGCELHLSRQAGHKREHLPPAVCVLRLPKSGMTVLASIQDFGGDMRGRSFPIVFYAGVPSATWPGPTSDRILPALRVLKDLVAFRDSVVRFVNAPGRFESTFGGREVQLDGLDADSRDESWKAAARAVDVRVWFSAAGDAVKAETPEAWHSAVRTWGESIAALESDEFGPTFRFPIVMSLPFEAQVAGWLCWLERRMNLEQRFLSLLISKDAAAAPTGRLSIIAREVVPEDYLLFTSFAGTLAYLDDLCAVTPKAPDNGAEGAPIPITVRVPESWAAFVEATATE